MVRLVNADPMTALREINIVDGRSDAFKQANADYNLQGIPYTRVYGKNGKFLGAVKGADFDAVRELVEQGS